MILLGHLLKPARFVFCLPKDVGSANFEASLLSSVEIIVVLIRRSRIV